MKFPFFKVARVKKTDTATIVLETDYVALQRRFDALKTEFNDEERYTDPAPLVRQPKTIFENGIFKKF